MEKQAKEFFLLVILADIWIESAVSDRHQDAPASGIVLEIPEDSDFAFLCQPYLLPSLDLNFIQQTPIPVLGTGEMLWSWKSTELTRLLTVTPNQTVRSAARVL